MASFTGLDTVLRRPPDFRIIAKIAKKEEPQCLHSISNHLKIGGQAPRVIETLVDKLFEKFNSVRVELDLSLYPIDFNVEYHCWTCVCLSLAKRDRKIAFSSVSVSSVYPPGVLRLGWYSRQLEYRVAWWVRGTDFKNCRKSFNLFLIKDFV